jgi:pimeloyl-ACP methyl ester carboxylesterase
MVLSDMRYSRPVLMNEQSIRLSSGELTYLQAGSGRPLLYLHPAGGIRRSKVLEGLAQSFALYVPVFPGFEGTPFHPAIASRQALARLVAEFHRSVVKTRCDVMGWSFGGCVALWLALERPELVERLVLECPAGLISIDKRIKRVNRALLEHYGAEDGKDEALLARVGEIGHPTLILQGCDDGTIPPASAELLTGILDNAFLVSIAQAGHDLEVDQPERVLAAARKFLGQPR